MAVLDDIGLALTGGQVAPPQQQAQVGNSLTGLLDDPRARAALLSFGLQAMQPVGIGQTVGGHLAQSIGAAGEGFTRADQMDQKAALADQKMALGDAKLAQADRALDIRERKSTGRKIGGLTSLMQARFDRQDQAAYERRLDRDASDIAKRADKAAADAATLGGTVPDSLRPFVGKTPQEIRDILRTQNPRGGSTTARPAAATPAAPIGDDDEDDEEAVVPSAAVDAPPVPGARKAQDNNWYVPDPKRPGKYLRVR